MGMLARLGVVLGLDSGEFKQGLESADASLSKFTAKIPQFGAVAAAAFTAATYSAIKFADEIADAAKASDVAVSSVLALSKGLEQNGGNAADAGKMLAAFSAQIDEAAQGSLTAQKAFERIGVTLNDLAKLDTEGLFDKTVKGIAAIPDPAARAALAMSMFGKAAKGVDFVELAQGSDEAKKKMMEYAAAVEQAGELNDKLQAASGKLSLEFTNAVIPTLVKVFDALSNDTKAMHSFTEAVKTGVKFVAEIFYNMYTVVMMVGAAVQFVASAIKNLFSGQFDVIKKDFDVLTERVKELWNNAKAFHMEMKKPDETEPKGVKKFVGRQVTEAKNPEADKLKRMEEAIKMAQKLSVEYERQSNFDLLQLRRRAELNGLTEKQREIAQAILEMREQREGKLQDIESKRVDAIIKGEIKLAEELQRQKDIIAERSDFFIAETERVIKAIQTEQNSFEFGWNKAFAQFAEDLENNTKRGEELFSTLTNSMTSAIDKFVQTGKFSFADFTKSIIRDLIAIQMKAQVLSMFKMGMGSMGFSLPAKADGGYVAANEPYMVGERGPEMFIPQGAGTIIPNNRMQSGGGGSKTVNNFTINAIDTKSFEQRLFGSSNAIWAANQYANKSLAAAGGRS